MKTLGLGKIPRQASGGGIKINVGTVGSLAPAGGSFNIGFPTTIHHVTVSPIGHQGSYALVIAGTCSGAHYVKVNMVDFVAGSTRAPLVRTLAKIPFTYMVWGE